MSQTVRKALVLPRPSLAWAVPAATVAAFLWLLSQDAIQPVAIYLLELYLSF
jgi:hypothetical protein